MKTPDAECRSWHAPAKTPAVDMAAFFRYRFEMMARPEVVSDDKNLKGHGLNKVDIIFESSREICRVFHAPCFAAL